MKSKEIGTKNLTDSRKNYEMHVISHVHWDREWRYSFAETRMKLVEMMDRLFEILDNYPSFKYYHLDAHTILLEDYLEICPEREEKLRSYIAKGRLLIGPWYTLPEEFLVNGESVVRNLLIGHQTALRFGPVMKVGYTPTSCGQISQLPQIYAGFDIGSILFYRGINPDDAKAEFIWEGPDGTKALTFHFYTHGRANFFSLLLDRMFFGKPRKIEKSDKKKFFCFTGTQFMNLHETIDPLTNYCVDLRDQFHLTGGRYPNLHDAMGSLTAYHGDELAEALDNAKADAVSKATTKYLLYMDGCDTGAPHPYTLRIIEDANKISGKDRYVHSNLVEYVEKVKKAAKGLEVLKGEMRRQGKSMSNAVYSGILSARTYIKQRNTRAEYNLFGRAEPWATVAWLVGEKYPKGQLNKAAKYLLANHAHDSIQACSADAVLNDMEYRFNQCDEMAAGIFRRSLCRIMSKMPLNKENEFALVVFNSLWHSRSEVVLAEVDFSAEDRVSAFSLYDGDRKIPFQIVSHKQKPVLVEWLELNTRNFPVDSFTISFFAEDIPAMGYKLFRVVPGESGLYASKGLVKSHHTMDNEYLSVKINSDGSLKVLDKQTGRLYDKLHLFEDQGEVGDSLSHKSPLKDKRITSLNRKTIIKLERADYFCTIYQIITKLPLPVKASLDKTCRVGQTKMLTISSRVTLKRGSKKIDIATKFNNIVSDHRLRVLFPSGIKTDKSWAAGQFDVLSRPIKSDYKKGWAEAQVTGLPNYGFVDITDGEAGLAILNEGLTEYQVLDDDKRTIALTLVRSFKDVFGVSACENPGSQCLREFEWRYAIYPHKGDYRKGNVYEQTQSFNIPLESAQCGRRGGTLGDEISFFRLAPECLILSAFKRSENGKTVIVRFFNSTSQKVKGTIQCYWNIKKAWVTNLNEERQVSLKVRDKTNIVVDVGPKKIITLELQLDN